MRLKLRDINLRHHISGGRGVIDEDTGKTVGQLSCSWGSEPRRHISLFDGKYNGGFDTFDECIAFAKGVEAVLNHMISTDAERSSEQEPTVAA